MFPGLPGSAVGNPALIWGNSVSVASGASSAPVSLFLFLLVVLFVQTASFIVVPLRCSPLPAPVFFMLEVSVDVRLSSEVLSSAVFSLLLLSPLKAFFISVTCFQSVLFLSS